MGGGKRKDTHAHAHMHSQCCIRAHTRTRTCANDTKIEKSFLDRKYDFQEVTCFCTLQKCSVGVTLFDVMTGMLQREHDCVPAELLAVAKSTEYAACGGRAACVHAHAHARTHMHARLRVCVQLFFHLVSKIFFFPSLFSFSFSFILLSFFFFPRVVSFPHLCLSQDTRIYTRMFCACSQSCMQKHTRTEREGGIERENMCV